MNAAIDTTHPSRFRIAAAFLAVYVIWGSTYLAIRFAVETLPPLLMAGVRHFVSGVILVAWVARSRAIRPTREQYRDAAIVGLLLLLGGNGLVTWAEQWVPSGLTALLVATVPLWMALLNGVIDPATRPHARGWAGIALGLGGVALLVEPRGELAADARTLAGAFGVICAALLWATGSVYSRRAKLPRDRLLSTGMQMLSGALGLALAGLLAGEAARVHVDAVSMRSFLALLYLIVFGSIVGFTAYVWLLQVVSPSKVATYAFVNPAVAVLLGVTLGGETLAPRTLVATAIIVASVVAITTERRAPRPAVPRPGIDRAA